MRQVYQSRELIESANTGRIGRLIKGPEESQMISLMNDSRTAKDEIDKLEAHLFERSDELMGLQKSGRIPFEKDDLIWIKGGWAEVINPVEIGENTKVYLHAKAEEKTVSTKLFLNVTGLAKIDTNITNLWQKVSSKSDSKLRCS